MLSSSVVVMTTQLPGTTQVNAVSARDLHEKLGVKQPFTHWVKYRIQQAMLEEGKDYEKSLINPEGGGRPQHSYIITLDAAKHIAMLERTEIGKAIRQYFIDIEKAAAEGAKGSPKLQAQMEGKNATEGQPGALPWTLGYTLLTSGQSVDKWVDCPCFVQ